MDRQLYAQPGRQNYEITVRAANGELRDAIYYKATYTDAHGEIAGLIGAIIDITGRTRAERALRENEERWRAIFNSANEGILVYDRELNIVAGNQAAERIIGLPLAEVIGAAGFTSLLPCVHPDGSAVLPDERPTRATVRSGKPLSGYVIGIKRPGGAHTWLSVNTSTWIMVIAVVLLTIVLARTTAGRYMYAAGGNAEAINRPAAVRAVWLRNSRRSIAGEWLIQDWWFGLYPIRRRFSRPGERRID